jgi:hypothetical protein
LTPHFLKPADFCWLKGLLKEVMSSLLSVFSLLRGAPLMPHSQRRCLETFSCRQSSPLYQHEILSTCFSHWSLGTTRQGAFQSAFPELIGVHLLLWQYPEEPPEVMLQNTKGLGDARQAHLLRELRNQMGEMLQGGLLVATAEVIVPGWLAPFMPTKLR